MRILSGTKWVYARAIAKKGLQIGRDWAASAEYQGIMWADALSSGRNALIAAQEVPDNPTKVLIPPCI